eukprot:scaffold26652_cov151-Skeletonema_menzelii.AAC.8
MDPHGSSDPWPSALHCLALLYSREREKRGAHHNRTFESKNIKKAAGKVSTFCQRQPEIEELDHKNNQVQVAVDAAVAVTVTVAIGPVAV